METSPLPPNRTYEERISEFTRAVLGMPEEQSGPEQNDQPNQESEQLPVDS